MLLKQLANNSQAKFSFQPVSIHTVKEVMEGSPWNKAGEIPIKTLKGSGLSLEHLSSCVNEAFSSSKFAESLKQSNIVHVHKKASKYLYGSKYLVFLSKVFAKITFDQIFTYMNNFLNKVFCRFCKGHSTQHALFKLLQAWQKELDNLEFIGTILMDLSKSCLPHDLLTAKLWAYGLRRSSIRLLMDNLNSR